MSKRQRSNDQSVEEVAQSGELNTSLAKQIMSDLFSDFEQASPTLEQDKPDAQSSSQAKRDQLCLLYTSPSPRD